MNEASRQRLLKFTAMSDWHMLSEKKKLRILKKRMTSKRVLIINQQSPQFS